MVFELISGIVLLGSNVWSLGICSLGTRGCRRFSDGSSGDSYIFGDIQRLSPLLRDALNAAVEVVHPEDASIFGVSHILWTGKPKARQADARNAVFYGRKAIDRSPCGTGTSARMAQLVARGALEVGDEFVHESIIGSLFHGRVEDIASVGNYPAIIPSVEGWARITGFNTIVVDERDPYAHGFEVV